MGTGKKKIEIKKKEKAEDRMITFSKRKKGLFRKASQLNVLSGFQIGIVVFSPAGRPHTNSPMFDDALSLYLSFIAAPAPSPADNSGIFDGNMSDDDVSVSLNSIENLLLGSAGGGEWSICGGDYHAGEVGGTSSFDDNNMQNHNNVDEWLNSIEIEKIEKLEDLLFIKQRLEIMGEKISDKICSSYLV